MIDRSRTGEHRARTARMRVGASLLACLLTACVNARAPTLLAAPSPTAFSIKLEDAVIDVRLDQALQPEAALIRQWIEGGIHAVRGYYARFPVARLALHVDLGNRPGVLGGKSFGQPAPLVKLTVGANTSAAQFAQDWMLAHELIHLSFPAMAAPHEWAQEGLATYVEPIARHAVGQVSARVFWRELMEGLPKGTRELARAGLDDNGSWGATYWGGALFWFLADIEIRSQSDNQQSLADALRAILAAGGNSQAHWAPAKAFARGDGALRKPVLLPLYERMRHGAQAVDLDALWRQLGVRLVGDEVRFEDSASISAVRRAIAG